MGVVATFYKFVRLTNYVEQRELLLSYCQQQGIKGTILLAAEGINGTIWGTRPGIDLVLTFLRSNFPLEDLEYKESYTDRSPFERMKVKLKKEIVTLGIPEVDPNQQVGNYVDAKDWNQLICDPGVLVIDTRNDYEISTGSFKRAINPQTSSFREFPDYVDRNLDRDRHKKVAMFCTGGIRCEKASSYLMSKGFESVYHLKGGILKYLQEVPPQDSLWEGECFVFDDRVAVQHSLTEGNYQMCLSCGHPLSQTDRQSPKYEEGISCSYCFDRLTAAKKARQEEKMRQKKQNKPKNN